MWRPYAIPTSLQMYVAGLYRQVVKVAIVYESYKSKKWPRFSWILLKFNLKQTLFFDQICRLSNFILN